MKTLTIATETEGKTMTFKDAPREMRDGELKIEKEARRLLTAQLIAKRKTLLDRLERL